jgi:hypothetical protein
MTVVLQDCKFSNFILMQVVLLPTHEEPEDFLELALNQVLIQQIPLQSVHVFFKMSFCL